MSVEAAGVILTDDQIKEDETEQHKSNEMKCEKINVMIK